MQAAGRVASAARLTLARASVTSSSSAAACAEGSFLAVRRIRTSSSLFSEAEKAQSPVEKKLEDRAMSAGAQMIRKGDTTTLKSGQPVPPKINDLVNSILALNIIEAMQLSEVLKSRLGVPDTAMPFGAAMFAGGAPGGAAQAAPAPAQAAPAQAAPAAAPKEEKTHVDIKLKAYKAENKIKVIKEVRAVTNLGLKEVRTLDVMGSGRVWDGRPRQHPRSHTIIVVSHTHTLPFSPPNHPTLPPQAKDLVESVPCTLLQKVKKEDAAKIVEKLKTETGAELELV
jgi:large subunit ribosomal protein L7/L12